MFIFFDISLFLMYYIIEAAEMTDTVEIDEIETGREDDRGVDREINEEADHRKETDRDLDQDLENDLLVEEVTTRNLIELIEKDLTTVSVIRMF